MISLSRENLDRLNSEANIWFGSVRSDGRPHLTPVWFAWWAGSLYVCIAAESVKFRNIVQNRQVVLSLEDGSSPLICEGVATPLTPPYTEDVVKVFQKKYHWDIRNDSEYSELVEIKPHKWLSW